ncbi:response regulator transcription factor [Mucilaginibacter sp. AW1-7]|jgi:CheY-like chemotaxis protein|uniref:response regulator transcription factor n=1 Tax=unclassified Mucilaginibacter TaxID=2617802 RepID=UPI002366CBD5|nr:response regulator [Mucilaginibacter sp. KACC 22773]WDF79913.1 response regulator [Mucilaginibacter sp. KACC 22773]
MKTILLIEDNDDIRENTCELLELEGYKVILALNGKTGLLLAAEHLPDLILCDIMMPGADGYEVFGELQSNPSTGHIPFIFLTASAEKKDVAAGLQMGASGYIRKPFEPEELFEAIKLCFDKPTV